MANESQKDLNQASLNLYQHHVGTPAIPVKMGNKYLCPHYKAEVLVKQDCPSCRLEIDWTKI